MKKSIFIFFLVFQHCTGISQNLQKMDFLDSLQNLVEEKIFVDLFVKDAYQSTFIEFLECVNFQTDSLEILDRIKEEYRPFFANKTEIELQFDTLEIVFNQKESVVIMNTSGITLERMKLVTQDKLDKFLMFIENNNKLPQSTFEYLHYKFNVLKNGEKWLYITYKISSKIVIIDRTIVNIKT